MTHKVDQSGSQPDPAETQPDPEDAWELTPDVIRLITIIDGQVRDICMQSKPTAALERACVRIITKLRMVKESKAHEECVAHVCDVRDEWGRMTAYVDAARAVRELQRRIDDALDARGTTAFRALVNVAHADLVEVGLKLNVLREKV